MQGALRKNFVSTRNPCKLCAPLGAALVFKGIEGAVPLLHGSQGCSTYIRRYLISHFREPVDIASSNFSEETAIFGGEKNLAAALANIATQYHPDVIGIATTCLSETIGEDMAGMLRNIPEESLHGSPVLVHVSTPSYAGSHAEGFWAATRAVVKRLADKKNVPERPNQINIFPGICSPADLRYLKEIVADFALSAVFLPDYSQTMDGPGWPQYRALPSGGTSVKEISSMSSSAASLTFGRIACVAQEQTAGEFLRYGSAVVHYPLGMPVGIRETDEFMRILEKISGMSLVEKYLLERGRLTDAMVDGHKYVFEKKAFVYGEEDLVLGLASFLSEIGIIPVLCASGGKSGHLRRLLTERIPELQGRIEIADDEDFAGIAETAKRLRPDILIGNSKGYHIARQLDVPLIRVGFPVHDRIGAQRILHYGYRGAMELYDRIVNALLDKKQDDSQVGYSYL